MLPVLLDLSDIKILCICDFHWSGVMLVLFYRGLCCLLNPKQKLQRAWCSSKFERFVKTHFSKATGYKAGSRIIRGNIMTSTCINYSSLPLSNILGVPSFFFFFFWNILLSNIFAVFFLSFICFTPKFLGVFQIYRARYTVC